MIYALGRGIAASYLPTIRAIVRRASTDGYRFSTVLDGIVNGPAFQMRRTTGLGES